MFNPNGSIPKDFSKEKIFAPINSAIHEFFNITSVTPLLNSELIEYSTHLSSNYKYDQINNIGKIPLRQLLKKYGMNDLINNQNIFEKNLDSLYKKDKLHI